MDHAQISFPVQYGTGPFEVTYIDAFGRLKIARYQTLKAAQIGFGIAARMSARLWFNPSQV